jgi:L-lactate utilization protein LutC
VVDVSVIIIGVDSGLSTGIAEIYGGRRGLVFQGPPADAINELTSRLEELEQEDHTVTVACELFRKTGRAAHTHQPEAEVTAVKAALVAEMHGARVVLQPPADAKRIASNALLQRSGLWTLPSEIGRKDANDVNDAMRHAVLAMSRYHASQFDSLLAYAASRY